MSTVLRLAAILFLSCPILLVRPLAAAQSEADPMESIDEIDEIAEEGVKAAVVAGLISEEEAEQMGEAAELIYDTKPGEGDAPSPEEVDREFVGMLGGELKAAVESGSMSESDAWSVYLATVADVRSWYAEQEEAGREVTVPWSRQPNRSGEVATLRLFMLDPEGLQLLLRPEYARRDARHIAAELRLDPDTTNVLELLVSDYLESYDRAVEQFQSTLDRGRRGDAVRRLDAVLSDVAAIDLASLDWQRISERNPWMGDKPEGRIWMEDSIGRFQQVIGPVRGDLERRRAELLAEGPMPGLREQLAALGELRQARERLRLELESQLRGFLPEADQAALEAVLAELEIDRALVGVTLAGIRVNFELALRRAADLRPFDPLPDAQRTMMRATGNELLDVLRPWMRARLEAEVAGFELVLRRQSSTEPSESSTVAYGRALMDVAEREVQVRDTVQRILEGTRGSLAETDDRLAARFREESMLQGFPTQMRPRWCERAAGTALGFADLDPSAREAVVELQSSIDLQLPGLRDQAIMTCLELEPRVARARVRRVLDPGSRSDLELLAIVREPGHDRFTDLDDRTEDLLEALLTEEQFERLPRRPGRPLAEWNDEKSSEGKGKGGGKSGGKSGDKSGGKSDGRSGGKGGGKRGGK